MNNEVVVYLISKAAHCSQVFTGFRKLENEGLIRLTVKNLIERNGFPNNDKAIVLTECKDKRIVFDLQDGYWDGMDYYIDGCDYYYKRSFSAQKNTRFTQFQQAKLNPLGFNYFVTCKDNPYEYESIPRSIAKTIIGISRRAAFTADLFEQKPILKDTSELKIVYFTRLYDYSRNNKNRTDEFLHINANRINLLRSLRECFNQSFVGGVEDSRVARRMAPDLVMPKRMTEKGNYINLIHTCDIGIGSMGLHESIGWKTAEYIASSMGIVNEEFHYSVPGNFEIGKNYLSFKSTDECVEKVKQLIENPNLLQMMKINNWTYYQNYLVPDKLVWNALQHCG